MIKVFLTAIWIMFLKRISTSCTSSSSQRILPTNTSETAEFIQILARAGNL